MDYDGSGGLHSTVDTILLYAHCGVLWKQWHRLVKVISMFFLGFSIVPLPFCRQECRGIFDFVVDHPIFEYRGKKNPKEVEVVS